MTPGGLSRRPQRVNHQTYDPVRQLLAAIVLEAVRDCTVNRRVSAKDRASAQAFLAGEEGLAWLRAFGIPVGKGRSFIQNGHRIVKEEAVDRQKVMAEWIATTEETIYTLQMWLGLLESWQTLGQAEPDDFAAACRQLKEAGLEVWVDAVDQSGLQALAQAVGLNTEDLPD